MNYLKPKWKCRRNRGCSVPLLLSALSSVGLGGTAPVEWEFWMVQSLCYHVRAGADKAGCNWSQVTARLALLALPRKDGEAEPVLALHTRADPAPLAARAAGLSPRRKLLT